VLIFVFDAGAIDTGITDRPDRAVFLLKFFVDLSISTFVLVLIPRKHEDSFDVDRYSQIDTNSADGVSESFEADIGLCVFGAHNDHFPAPQDHLIKSEVLEVATV